MLLLSKYSVLEYLLWVKSNEFNKSKYSKFYKDLTDNFEKLHINSFLGGTRNLVYIFELNQTKYIFKQFRVTSEKEGNYFKNEVFVLGIAKLSSLLPKVIFVDEMNFVIIEEYLDNFSNFGVVFKKFIENAQDKSINKILIKIATELNEFHQHADLIIRKPPESNKKTFRTFENEFIEYYENYLWEENSYIHSDLNVSNVLVDADNVENLRIIDWEMSEKGDKYYDLITIIKAICICSLSSFFFISYGDSKVTAQRIKFDKIKRRVQTFLDAYDSKIDKKKLEAFFVINNHSAYYAGNNAFFTNINALFK